MSAGRGGLEEGERVVERRYLSGGGSFRAIVPEEARPCRAQGRLRVDLLVFCFRVLARTGGIYVLDGLWLLVSTQNGTTTVGNGQLRRRVVDGRLAGGRYRYGPRTHQHPHTPCDLCHSSYGDGAKDEPAGCRYPDFPKLSEAHARPNLARHPCAVCPPPPPCLWPKSQDTESTVILANLSAAILAHHPLLDDGTELAWTVGALARWPLLALSAWQEEITLGQYMGPRDPSPSHPPQLQAFPLNLERQK